MQAPIQESHSSPGLACAARLDQRHRQPWKLLITPHPHPFTSPTSPLLRQQSLAHFEDPFLPILKGEHKKSRALNRYQPHPFLIPVTVEPLCFWIALLFCAPFSLCEVLRRYTVTQRSVALAKWDVLSNFALFKSFLHFFFLRLWCFFILSFFSPITTSPENCCKVFFSYVRCMRHRNSKMKILSYITVFEECSCIFFSYNVSKWVQMVLSFQNDKKKPHHKNIKMLHMTCPPDYCTIV